MNIKEMVGKRFFSVDAETDGLWGNPFSVGAIVYEIKRNYNKNTFKTSYYFEQVEEICLRLPNEVVKNEWVKLNVLPNLDFEVTHQEYKDMLKDFADFYLRHKNATVIWHMGYIVEAHLFRELHKMELIGDWDAPYTPIEISDLLRMKDYDCDSVDNYAKINNLFGFGIPNKTHNPLYDCFVSAQVFEDILKKL